MTQDKMTAIEYLTSLRDSLVQGRLKIQNIPQFPGSKYGKGLYDGMGTALTRIEACLDHAVQAEQSKN